MLCACTQFGELAVPELNACAPSISVGSDAQPVELVDQVTGPVAAPLELVAALPTAISYLVLIPVPPRMLQLFAEHTPELTVPEQMA
jgi:hypothetical protein